MAEKGAEVTAKVSLSAAEKQLLLRRRELDNMRRSAARLRSRNLLTGLGIGALVLGMFSYTILTVKQEKIMDELDNEAKIHVFKLPRTGANS